MPTPMGVSLCRLVRIDVKTFVSDEEEANPFAFYNVTDIIYLLSQLVGASFRPAHTRYPFYRVTSVIPFSGHVANLGQIDFVPLI